MSTRRSFLREMGGLALAGVLGAPGGALARVAAQRREPVLGLNIQPPITRTTIAQLRELGIRHVRLSVWWGWYEAGPWAREHALLRDAGIEVLPGVTSPPARYERASSSVLARDLRAFISTFLARQGDFPYVQVLNEHDSGGPWFGPESGLTKLQAGRRYGQLLDLVAPVIRDAGARVVTMGMGDPNPEFIRGMVEVAGDSIDVIALHTYGDHVWGEPWSRYRHARTAGWRGPVWVTEFGMHGDWTRARMLRVHRRRATAAEVEQAQLDNWRIPLTEDESRFEYERVYGFQLPAHEKDDGFGLVRLDGSPRPTYEWLRRRAMSR